MTITMQCVNPRCPQYGQQWTVPIEEQAIQPGLLTITTPTYQCSECRWEPRIVQRDNQPV